MITVNNYNFSEAKIKKEKVILLVEEVFIIDTDISPNQPTALPFHKNGKMS